MPENVGPIRGIPYTVAAAMPIENNLDKNDYQNWPKSIINTFSYWKAPPVKLDTIEKLSKAFDLTPAELLKF
ncbi:MAG: hypothetical protein NTY47_01535 [Candidatus Omnitrophica bacterium]|nr:hypothetical protein [Candidatus Omnitrophota bacterium]